MLRADLPPESERLFTWRPNPGPQTEFLASSAYELLYGGAAGPGKTESLIVCPLRWVNLPDFRGIIFRRTFPELEKSIIDRSRTLYPAVIHGAHYRDDKKFWTFPSGARIYFSHLEHETSVFDHQSAEYQYIGFDELTHFTEKQYVYMLSRARSSKGVPIRIRAGSNPGGPGADWVFKRWGRWLDRDHPNPLEPGVRAYYVNSEEGERWVDAGAPDAFSRQFIPGRIEDNPHLGPEYRRSLMGQDRVTRAQLLHGDWMIRPAAGAYFQRDWFKWIDVAPLGGRRVRRWDLASTEDGDWTIGVRMASHDDGRLVIEDVVRARKRPAGVQALVMATAEIDGRDVAIGIPQDPGQAGVDQRDAYSKMLSGYNVRFGRETGDKVTRAQPFSAQAEAGNVYAVKARWNEPFMQSLEAFPDEHVHDDDVDAAAGAFNMLRGGEPIASFNGGTFKSPGRVM